VNLKTEEVNIRKNEDRRLTDDSAPRVNIIHEVQDISDESGDITEPVTKEQFKNFARVEGFDNSGEFNFDDDLIEAILTASREDVEKFTGTSLIPKTLKVFLTNECGMISLPGPVHLPVTLTDEEGEDIEDPETFGGDFPRLKTEGTRMIATYDAGYTVCPKWATQAILRQSLYLYEHRGEEFEDKGLCQSARMIAAKHRRVTWL
jgi:hypothetical protein